MTLEDLKERITASQALLERKRGIRDSLVEREQLARQQATQAQHRVDVCEQAARFLAQFADDRQAHVIETIQNIASVGLSQVFDEPIELRIEQVVRARRIEMDVKVKTGDLETSILDARGGGLAAVAGFLLRASVLLLTPGARKMLVLDEVFSQLSADYVPRLAQFLSELSEKSGLQIILVTHDATLSEAADKIIRIEKVGANTSRLVMEN